LSVGVAYVVSTSIIIIARVCDGVVASKRTNASIIGARVVIITHPFSSGHATNRGIANRGHTHITSVEANTRNQRMGAVCDGSRRYAYISSASISIITAYR